MTEKLYAHQENFLSRNLLRALLCWDTGTGKTITSIAWANRHATYVLIIVPKALKANWLRNLQAHLKPSIRFKVMTKEEFRSAYPIAEPFDAIIVDEAHYFAGMTSQLSKMLTATIKKLGIKKVLLATATPYLSTPWNIYVLARHLGHQWSYFGFRERFFMDKYVGKRIVPAVRSGIEGEIAELVASIGDVVRLDECADVPEQVFETEFFELSPEQERWKTKTIETNPIVRFTKYHQIENGTLKGDEYEPTQAIHSFKNDRLLEVCRDNPKVIIVCRYTHQLHLLRDLLQKEFHNRPVFIIDGSTTGAARDKIVTQADAAPAAIALINASCSEGYELPSFPVMVFASLSFSYKDYKQMCGRILRINKLKKNLYVHLVAKGVDTAVYDAIMSKQDFDIEIYARETATKPDGVLGKELSDGLEQVV